MPLDFWVPPAFRCQKATFSTLRRQIRALFTRFRARCTQIRGRRHRGRRPLRVAEAAILPRGLRGVARPAQPLQVGPFVVGCVAIDVVDQPGLHDATRALAFRAEWIISQHRLAQATPRHAVSRERSLGLARTRTLGAVPLPLALLVLNAVARKRNASAAARMPADRTWTSRHQRDTHQAARSAAPIPR